MSLEDRLTILEAAVAHLLNLRQAESMPPPPLPGYPSLPPDSPLSEPIGGPGRPLPVPAPSALATPHPHPDWLPVLHTNGSAACGLPGVYLILPVSGVYKATPEALRILPRIQDAETGFWIVEPYREPRSDDVVRCASCGHPIEVWTNRDLDYRPYLLDEVGNPMYPRKAHEANWDAEQAALAERERARRDEQQQEASLLQLKAQAQQLHAAVSPWTMNNAP
jgi:hypothetical protein